MTDKKMRSWLWANIEGLEYITNKAFIENSENKNNRVNSAELQKQISIDQFFCSFFPFTQDVIIHISSRVAIIVKCFYYNELTEINWGLIAIFLERCFFFAKNIQNNGKITVIVGSSHSDVFRKKVEKLQMHMQRKSYL